MLLLGNLNYDQWFVAWKITHSVLNQVELITAMRYLSRPLAL
jgi:hypothetical protein